MEISNVEKMENELKQMELNIENMKKALAQERIKNPNFSQMTLKQLIHFKVKNEDAFWEYDVRNDNNPVISEWYKAYKVFQDKQLMRENIVFRLCEEYLAKHKGQIIVAYEMYKDLFGPIYRAYNMYTPFDCEDEKWTIRNQIAMHSNYSWDNRIKLVVRRYCDFKGINLNEVRIIDQRR